MSILAYQHYYVNMVQVVNNNTCMSKYYILEEDRGKYVCIKESKSNKYQKIEKCSAVENTISSYEECRKHPVYENGIFLYDYICVSKSGGGCKGKNVQLTMKNLKERKNVLIFHLQIVKKLVYKIKK